MFYEMPGRPQGLDIVGNLGDHLLELGGFGRGYPGELEPFRLEAQVLQEPFKQGELPTGVVVAGNKMAVTGVATGNPDPVRPVAESRQDELGVQTARAGNPDDPDVRWILETADAGQIGSSVGTPVAEKSDNFRFEGFTHDKSFLRLAQRAEREALLSFFI
jgi:hypothetical protein